MDKVMVGKERILLCICLGLGAISIFLTYTAPNVALAFTFSTCASIAIGTTSPVVFTLALKYLPKEFIGTGTGVANFGQQFAGIIAPTLFGFLISVFNGSYIAVFGSIVATSLIAMVVAATINTKKILKDSMEEKAAI